jgi:hypothetical protein
MAIGISPLVDYAFKLMLGSPEQLMLYNARLKLRRDEVARILRARLEGEEIGEASGKACGLLMGRIILLQELLGLPLSTAEQFAGSDEAQLNDMVEQLQQQLRSRNSLFSHFHARQGTMIGKAIIRVAE